MKIEKIFVSSPKKSENIKKKIIIMILLFFFSFLQFVDDEETRENRTRVEYEQLAVFPTH